MGKPQQSYKKKEREKKRLKKQQDKLDRRELRKQEKAARGKLTLEDQMSYLDENGNIVSEKPDPSKKVEIKLDQIVLGGNPGLANDDSDIERKGKVNYFDHDKGFGFIIDSKSGDRVFAHINDCYDSIKENHKVSYVLTHNPKGAVAINVELIN